MSGYATGEVYFSEANGQPSVRIAGIEWVAVAGAAAGFPFTKNDAIMKTNLLCTFFLFAVGAFLFYGNSSGAAAVQGADRTGSPLSSGACNICHSGGNFAPSLRLEILDGEEPISEYEPGAAYTMRLTINTDQGDPAAYGFQVVALTGDDDANAGAWGPTPDGIEVVTINGRDYAEQSEPRPENVIELAWTAPLDNPGEVRFYAAGNAVNGNVSTTGDAAASLSEPTVVTPRTSAFRSPAALDVELEVWPNPVVDRLELRIGGAAAGPYQLRIADVHGRILQRRTLGLPAGDHRETLDFSGLPAGSYLLHLSDGQRVAAQKVLKVR